MRLALIPPALCLSVAAFAEAPHSTLDRSPALMVTPNGKRDLPGVADRTPTRKLAAKPTNCRSRIEAARKELGQPKLDDKNAAADQPLPILAVYRLIDGCEVLVVSENDFRPLPDFSDSARLRPAH